jgi:hypothetical protein
MSKPKVPTDAVCVVSALDLLLNDMKKAKAEHFNEDNVCITCMDTGRDAIPWTELFTKGRQR